MKLYVQILYTGSILLSCSSLFSMSEMQFERERKYAVEKIDVLIQKPQKNAEAIRRILKELTSYIPTVKGKSADWQETQKKFVAEQQQRLTQQLLQEEEQALFVAQLATLETSIESALTIDELHEYLKTAEEVLSNASLKETEKRETLTRLRQKINQKKDFFQQEAQSERKERRSSDPEVTYWEDLFVEFQQAFDDFKKVNNTAGMQRMHDNLSAYVISNPVLKSKQQKVLAQMKKDITKEKAKVSERESKGEEAEAERVAEQGTQRESKRGAARTEHV